MHDRCSSVYVENAKSPASQTIIIQDEWKSAGVRVVTEEYDGSGVKKVASFQIWGLINDR